VFAYRHLLSGLGLSAAQKLWRRGCIIPTSVQRVHQRFQGSRPHPAVQGNREVRIVPRTSDGRFELIASLLKLIVCRAFVEGELDVPKHMARVVHNHSSIPSMRSSRRQGGGISRRRMRGVSTPRNRFGGREVRSANVFPSRFHFHNRPHAYLGHNRVWK